MDKKSDLRNNKNKLSNLINECCICYSQIEEFGTLDPCEHLFCYDCILKWSEEKNACPICKRVFVRIKKIIKRRSFFDELDLKNSSKIYIFNDGTQGLIVKEVKVKEKRMPPPNTRHNYTALLGFLNFLKIQLTFINNLNSLLLLNSQANYLSFNENLCGRLDSIREETQHSANNRFLGRKRYSVSEELDSFNRAYDYHKEKEMIQSVINLITLCMQVNNFYCNILN